MWSPMLAPALLSEIAFQVLPAAISTPSMFTLCTPRSRKRLSPCHCLASANDVTRLTTTTYGYDKL